MKSRVILYLAFFLPLSQSPLEQVKAQEIGLLQMPIPGLDPNGYDGTVLPPYTTVWQGNYNGGAEGSGAHTGVDLALRGRDVVAIADGTVIRLRRIGTNKCETAKGQEAWGVYLVIQHTVPGVGTIFSSYAHLESESIPPQVDVDRSVVRGQLIGRIGNTGNACGDAGGYHLHFQIDRDLGGDHPYDCGAVNVRRNIRCVSEQTINPVPFIRDPKFRSFPIGFFDPISDGVIRGWSFDPDQPNTRNTIQVFFDGPANSGTLIHSEPTDVFRPDVNAIYGISGDHGFEVSIPPSYHDGQAHTVYIYGIDLEDSTQSTLLTGSPREFVQDPAPPVAPELTISTASCLSALTCSGPPGTTFSIEGSGFSPSGNVRRFITGPAGSEQELTPLLTADSAGRISWSFTSKCSTPTGTFDVFARDEATGRHSNSVTEIHESGQCSVTRFFDGSDIPELEGATFGEPIIDPQGNLVLTSLQNCANFPGNTPCDLRVNSIASTGQLNWRSDAIRWQTHSSFVSNEELRRGRLLRASDRAYLLGGSATIYAFSYSGIPIDNWPVTVSEGDLIPFPILDNRDETLYVKAGFGDFGHSNTRIAAIRPEGTEDWRLDYEFGASVPLVQGPKQDIFTITGLSFRGINHQVGEEFCATPLSSFFDQLVAGPQSVFTSFRSSITSWDALCDPTAIFTGPYHDILLEGYNDGIVIGRIFPSFDIADSRLGAFSEIGDPLWLNEHVLPGYSVDSLGLRGRFYRPVRIIRNGVLYVLGSSTSTGKAALFLMDALSGNVMNSVKLDELCWLCGVVVSDSGTIYVNDLESMAIFSID